MDFNERTAEYLLENLDLDSFGTDSDGKKEILFRTLEKMQAGVAILDSPSVTGTKFLDRSKIYNLNFQVAVKNQNQTKARAEAYAIYQELDDLPILTVEGKEKTIESKDKSFLLKNCNGVNLPQLTSITEEDSFIYTMNMEAELFIKAK